MSDAPEKKEEQAPATKNEQKTDPHLDRYKVNLDFLNFKNKSN